MQNSVDITTPFAKVIIDNNCDINMFFIPDINHSVFKYFNIGQGIIDFCEVDLSRSINETKKLDTIEISSKNIESIKNVFWTAVDYLKDEHLYAHFFLESEIIRKFYAECEIDTPLEEKVDYLRFIFIYYSSLQKKYKEALLTCLDKDVFSELPIIQRYNLFMNTNPNFGNYLIRTMYAIMPFNKNNFDRSKLIKYDDPSEVDTQKVFDSVQEGSYYPVNLHPYFAIQSLEEMLYVELMEMIKRGLLVKRCALCDKYFVLPDKRKRDYCNRIYKDGRTCKQIGAKLKFNKTVDDDKFLQEFQTIYNRMYSRYYRMDALNSDRETNKLTEEEFKVWSESASKLRQSYKEGLISGDEMIEKINSIL